MAVKTNYSKNGSEYYRVTATIGRDSNGKPIRKDFYGKGKKDAESKRDEYLNGLRNGLSRDFKEMTIGKLFHSWLFEVVRISSKIKPSSFQKYEGIYRNYIKSSDLFGIKLNDLKSIDIQRYYNKLYEKDNKSSNVIKNLNKLFKTYFEYAISEGYILRNPCKSVVVPKDTGREEDSEEINPFEDSEVDAIKAALVGHRLNALFLLDFGTGLRQGELLGLKKNDIDLNRMELHVNQTIKQVNIIDAEGNKEYKTIEQIPKTPNSLRTVPIPSKLKPVLEEHFKRQEAEKEAAGSSYTDSDYVFVTELGKTIDASNLVKIYKRILTKANVEYRKFHSIRHTYATKLFEARVPLKTISMLLGHADISITADIYTHVMPKEKINAAEELNGLFD